MKKIIILPVLYPAGPTKRWLTNPSAILSGGCGDGKVTGAEAAPAVEVVVVVVVNKTPNPL